MRPRFMVSELGSAGVLIKLKADEARHGRVRRLRTGEEVSLFDGRGGEAIGRIEFVGRASIGVVITQSCQASPRPGFRLTLALGLIKWERFRLALEKATEMGTAAFYPLQTERSQPLRPGLETKMQKVVAGALKQCHRSIGPHLAPPGTLSSFLEAATGPEYTNEARFVLEKNAPPLSGIVQEIGPETGAILLIGPEGGFSQGEFEKVQKSGFKPGSVSDAVLRSDTAAVVGTALIMNLAGRQLEMRQSALKAMRET